METNSINAIGLDSNKSAVLAKQLNELLANYSICYQNVKGYHWNIEGEKFFELHFKFEELHNGLMATIDEVAERVRTLGHTPEHRYSSYKQLSKVQESESVSNSIDAVADIVASLGILITLQRRILCNASETNDEGTVALMSDSIQAQEKLVWMYSAFQKNANPT